MLVMIGDVLSASELEAATAALSDAGAYRDGARTAGRRARRVKNNRQLDPRVAAPVVRKVEAALLSHPVFQAAAWPKRLVGTLVSRYEPGMAYGTHVDDALMQGIRTDLSFTLFLSDPAVYVGGELVLETASGEEVVRGDRGAVVLYPSGALHRVNEVTSGIRLAVVGWVRSFIRDPRQREILFDLANVIASLEGEPGAAGGTPAAGPAVRQMQLDSLTKMRANLLRMWAED